MPGSTNDETEALGQVLVGLASNGMAVLLVEHDMSLVMSICDQVTVLHYGEIIASGNPEAVQADAAVQAAYLGTEDTRRAARCRRRRRSHGGDSLLVESGPTPVRPSPPLRRTPPPSKRPCWS